MKKSSGLDALYHRLRRRITKTRVRVPVIWYRHRGLTDRDTFIAAYPRSGSTWLRFLLLETLSGRPSVFDLVNAQIGIVGRHHGNLPLLPNGGRLISTHEPYRREYRKAVYLVRDPRDIVLSEFAFNKAGHRISCDFETFLNWFVQGKANGYGFWADHVRSWLDSPPAKNGDVLMVQFQELRTDTDATLAKIVGFLGAPVDPAVIRNAIENNTLKKMQEKEDRSPRTVTNSEGERFVRTGSVEGWRGRLTPAQIELIESHAHDVLLSLGYPITRT